MRLRASPERSVPAGYASAARTHGIPADIFYAVALTESGKVVDRFRTRRPWPWTLNVGGRGYFYAPREDAHRALRRFLAQGKRSIDIGLMQVNLGVGTVTSSATPGGPSIRITTYRWVRASSRLAIGSAATAGTPSVATTLRTTRSSRADIVETSPPIGGGSRGGANER